MEGEAAKRNVYDAVIAGDVARIIQLLEQDRYLVDEVSFACSRNILHIATMHEQAGIVEEITMRHPQLARNLDSQKSSPLHIAAEKGYVEIVANLLRIAPEMCWWRDGQGMNPVHIAAMHGHHQILRLLINENRLPAMEKLDRGQTVLHLCVKHTKFEAFEVLVQKLVELVNVEDDDGDTVLHSAVRLKRVGFVRYLVANHRTYELPRNSKRQTVQEICREGFEDVNSLLIDRILSQRMSRHSDKPESFIGTMSEITMVVVVLIAAMAFQAVVSPAGGVWQVDDSSPSSSPPLHKAGEAVMASTRPEIFRNFIRANAVAFTSSIATIVLLTTGLPSRHKLFTMAAMCTMWLSLACIAISYVASAIVISPNKETQSITHVIHVLIALFLVIYAMFCFSSVVTSGSRLKAYWMAWKWRPAAPPAAPAESIVALNA